MDRLVCKRRKGENTSGQLPVKHLLDARKSRLVLRHGGNHRAHRTPEGGRTKERVAGSSRHRKGGLSVIAAAQQSALPPTERAQKK